MPLIHKLLLFLIGATSIPVGYVFYSSAFSSHDWVYQGHGQWADAGVHATQGGGTQGGDGGRYGAPGPLAGAGLPLVVLAGGAYWVVRRYRRNAK
jgi:hypothetical protein